MRCWLRVLLLQKHLNLCLFLWFLLINADPCQGFGQDGDVSTNFETVLTRGNLAAYLKSAENGKPKTPGSSKLRKYNAPIPKEKASTRRDDERMKHKGTKSPSGKMLLPHITETTLVNDTSLGAIVVWTHFDSQVIFMITCDHIKKYGTKSFCTTKSNFYRSGNYGETFNLETNKFINGTEISTIFVSPLSRKLVFALDKVNSVLYQSFDEGVTYNKTILHFDPLGLSFHPTLRNILLIKDIDSNAYLSNDTGRSWMPIASKVRKIFWSSQRSGNRSQLLFEKISMHNTKLPTKNYSLVYISPEPFTRIYPFDPNLGPIYPNSLLVKTSYIYIQRKSSAGNKRLFVLHKDSPHFEECELATNELHLNYHFLKWKKDQVMLAALTESGTTNIYVASKNGRQFSLILEKAQALWNENEVTIDLHIVDAVPDTLIANIVGKGTFISYNSGGLWKRLIPPEFDESGNSIKCYYPECLFKLSLHIQDENVIGWSQITSSKYVPGVVIAQGKVVRVSNKLKVSLRGYISTDGGQSWRQGLSGRHVYRLLDYGGLFAGIAITNPFLHQNTNRVDYSCDDGRSWNSVLLPNQLSLVVGVAAHPAARSNVLKIFGADISDSQMLGWTIWKVNFSSVFEHKCFAENYTMWVAGPENVRDSCILGRRYIYERRKEGLCCSYGLDFERKTNVSTCTCEMSDFECDYGFKREEIGGFCSPTSFASLNPPVNCPEGKEYTQSKGYIKIKGDRCQGGIESEILPVVKLCPAMAPDGLLISVQKYSIALGKTAEITLHQQSGFLGTRYAWDYGDGIKEYNLTFDDNKRYHKYEHVGTYVISVLASNSAGSFTAKTVMRIIERVSEVFLHVTKPVVAMEEAVYTAELISHGSGVADRHGFVHFAWIFEPIKTPALSLNSSITHTYKSPGTYEVEVRVFNAISVVSSTMSVAVFGDVRVLRLQFSSTLDLLNQGTKEWIEFFKMMVYQYLIKTFKIRRDMIEVEVSKNLPTIVTLSLVQNTVPRESGTVKSTPDPSNPGVRSIDAVMHEIIKRVQNRKISFFLMGQEVRVLEAAIIRDRKEQKGEIAQSHDLSTNTKRDLYIGFATGGLLLLVCGVCVIVCYRRRLHRRKANLYLEMTDECETMPPQDLSLNAYVET